jgi:hypothetical protein
MENLLYIDNDPTKPVIYIGIIFYAYFQKDNCIKFLLMENSFAKYEDIGIIIDNNNIDNNIIRAIQFHTNFLIDLSEDLNTIKSPQDIYISSEMSLIRFVKAPNEFINFKTTDFGSYTVKSNDEKIKRYIKWIDYNYLFKFLYKFNKMSKKLVDKHIIDKFKSINSEHNLNLILSDIHKKIKSSTI